MTCYHPIEGYHSTAGGFTASRNLAYTDRPLTVPCGQCIGCRIAKAQAWALRCSHEASLHKENSYITLTYNDENLPYNGSIDLTHFQLFIDRLRKTILPKKIRYYHCGEYGDKTQRPHYHALIFGHEWTDLKYYKDTKNGDKLYTSLQLNDTWGLGNCYIGAVTFKSAGYCARYIMKKQTGKNTQQHYQFIDDITGEIYDRAPEYSTMSRRPGIAAAWYAKYASDLYPHDYAITPDGKKIPAPDFYDKLYKEAHEASHRTIKGKRKIAARKHSDNNTPERLAVREKIQQLKTTNVYKRDQTE